MYEVYLYNPKVGGHKAHLKCTLALCDCSLYQTVHLFIIVAFLVNATIEYSPESPCVCECVFVCVLLKRN